MEIIPYPVAVTSCDQADLFSDVQVMVDALDSSKDRLTLAAIAAKCNVPLVHGTVAGFEGRVMTMTPGDGAHGDALRWLTPKVCLRNTSWAPLFFHLLLLPAFR